MMKTVPKNIKSYSGDRSVKKKKVEKQARMSFTQHLDEFRQRIIYIFIFFVVLFAINLNFYAFFWQHLMLPMAELIKEAQKKNIVLDIVTTKLQDDFFIQLKICLLVTVLFSIPYILFQVWKFTLPAIKSHIKKWIPILLIFSYLLFTTGVVLANFFVWPKILNFFIFEWYPPKIVLPDNTVTQVKKYITIPEYLSFLFNFHLVFGLTFQIPIVSIVLGLFNLVNAKVFFSSWKGAFATTLIVAAILTPADWMSMIILSIPMFILYLISGCCVYLTQRFRK